MARMSESEEAAYRWLKRDGCKNIVFRQRDTPDFLTDKGGFEVKRPIGRTIVFTANQVQKVKEAKAKVLVFTDTGLKPLTIIPPNELERGIHNGFIVNITGIRRIVNFSDDLEKAVADYRSKQRPIPNFAEAVYELLWKALMKDSK